MCLSVFCVGPLCGPPFRWWVLCGAWGPPLCVGPLCASPVRVPCVGPLCGSPLCGSLCGSPVWVPRRSAFYVASTRMMSPARSHAPALYVYICICIYISVIPLRSANSSCKREVDNSYIYTYYMSICLSIYLSILLYIYII